MAYSEAQNRTLKSIDGLILYPYCKSGIPEYIHFLPGVLREGQSVMSILKQGVLKNPNRFYVLYFNPIRWIVNDLAETMRSLKTIPVKYGEFKIPLALSYGRITFDVTPDFKISDPEVGPLYRVPLRILDKQYFINTSDLPEIMGSPKIFEKIEFSW